MKAVEARLQDIYYRSSRTSSSMVYVRDGDRLTVLSGWHRDAALKALREYSKDVDIYMDSEREWWIVFKFDGENYRKCREALDTIKLLYDKGQWGIAKKVALDEISLEDLRTKIRGRLLVEEVRQ